MTWATAVPTTSATTEFDLIDLPCLSGTIPADLQGSYYRNGPGRLERGGRRVGHWFDGDGAILAVHLAGGQARATYRYVRSAGFCDEEAAGQLLHAGYGMVPPGQFWDRYRYSLKNAANTSVLALPDKLLALWEGGLPHALDRETLATFGEDDLGGITAPVSAHPKVDPASGDIYNFGIELGPISWLHLYRCDRDGRLQQQQRLRLPRATTIHDMALAGPYLVFCLPPIAIDILPVVVKLKPYADALLWQPELGMRLWVIDRQTFTLISEQVVEPWYQWHFGNSYLDAQGHIHFESVRYDDFATNEYLREMATGQTHTASLGTLWHYEVDPHSAKLLHSECRLNESCEFPVIAEYGQAKAATWLNLRHPGSVLGQDYLGEIGCLQGETVQRTHLEPHQYPSEPIHAQSASGQWVMSVISDTQQQRSEFWIWAATAIESEPVCRLALPQLIPLGFHGTWAA